MRIPTPGAGGGSVRKHGAISCSGSVGGDRLRPIARRAAVCLLRTDECARAKTVDRSVRSSTDKGDGKPGADAASRDPASPTARGLAAESAVYPAQASGDGVQKTEPGSNTDFRAVLLPGLPPDVLLLAPLQEHAHARAKIPTVQCHAAAGTRICIRLRALARSRRAHTMS